MLLKIISTFENGTMLRTFSIHIIKGISPTTRKDQSLMFECLINMIPQDTTTDRNQTHNTVQNLKFGMYLFMVLLKHNRIDNEIEHNLH